MDMEILESNADGSARVKGTYQSVDIDYGAGPMADMLKRMSSSGAGLGAALAGKSFTFKLSPAGEVSEIEGLAELQTAALQSLQVPEEGRKIILQMINEICSPENLKAMASGMFLYLPGKPVRIGESWSKQSGADFGVALSTENTWTLKEVRSDAIVLDRAMKITPGKSTGDSPFPGKMDISGTGTGVVEIDPATGWIRRSQTAIDTAGTMTIPAAQTSKGENRTVKMTSTGTNSTLVTRKK